MAKLAAKLGAIGLAIVGGAKGVTHFASHDTAAIFSGAGKGLGHDMGGIGSGAGHDIGPSGGTFGRDTPHDLGTYGGSLNRDLSPEIGSPGLTFGREGKGPYDPGTFSGIFDGTNQDLTVVRRIHPIPHGDAGIASPPGSGDGANASASKSNEVKGSTASPRGSNDIPGLVRPDLGADARLSSRQIAPEPTITVVEPRSARLKSLFAPPDFRARVNGELTKIAGQCGGGSVSAITVDQVQTMACLASIERIRDDCVADRGGVNHNACRTSVRTASCPGIGTETLMFLGAACAGVKGAL